MTKKVIVITGAAGGVGSMLALGLAKKSYHIVCLGRSARALAELVDNINSTIKACRTSYYVVDMMDTGAVENVCQAINETYPKVDVWINNVGVNNHNAIGPTWELDAKNWWNEVSLNLFTCYQGTAAAIRLMKQNNSGYVLNLGGGGVHQPKPFASAYGSAKTAIVKFTETVNAELVQEQLNIKAFSFNPGFIKNSRTEKLVESDVARQYMAYLEKILKHGKMSDVQDSVELIDTLICGKADALAGKYFFSDDKNIHQAIQQSDDYVQQHRSLLRVKS
ncbi:SDR family NAD(P)-dependent oxidoreductase [Thalassotalea sp. PLHSN55]|uniref:SDR family NAD(P)-dependent oxidoreductase n=1 Tax=Thalassotalea sp. PLHSN55 TaxID=3435888 RepID=UPI003F840B56